MIFQDTKWIWEQSIFVQAYRLKKLCNRSGRSKQQVTGLRAASGGAKRVQPGLSALFRHFEIKIHPIANKFA